MYAIARLVAFGVDPIRVEKRQAGLGMRDRPAPLEAAAVEPAGHEREVLTAMIDLAVLDSTNDSDGDGSSGQ